MSFKPTVLLHPFSGRILQVPVLLRAAVHQTIERVVLGVVAALVDPLVREAAIVRLGEAWRGHVKSSVSSASKYVRKYVSAEGRKEGTVG